MKKLTLAIVSVAFLFGNISFVNAKGIPGGADRKKAFKEMSILVDKYNKASEAEKPAIEKEIREKVSANYEERAKFVEERIAELENRVTEMKATLAEMKTEEGKNKYIDEETRKIISGEKKFPSKEDVKKKIKASKNKGNKK